MTQKELNDKLFKAIENDDLDQVKELISNGADVNTKNEWGETPLHYCFSTHFHEAHTAEIAKLLIDHGADVNAKDKEGLTPLHLVDDAESAKLLIEHGADVNAKDNDGKTPLHHTWNMETAKLLIDHGADVNAIDSNGWTPLFYAPDVNIAKILVENGADISIRDKYKYHALDMIENSMVEDLDETRPEYHKLQEIVNYLVPLYREKGLIRTQEEINEILIQSVKDDNLCEIETSLILGADINAKDNNLHKAPLFFANNPKIAEYLIKHGADINSTDEDGYTLLSQACFNGDLEIVDTLVKHGADINAKDKNGLNSLHATKDLKTIKYLLEHGANINEKDNTEWTPLYWAMALGTDFDVIKFLVENGADVNAKTNEGDTVLHRTTDMEIAKLLIDHGADVNAKNNNGETPLHHAGTADVAEVLINHGADINAKDNDGDTPLDAAKIKLEDDDYELTEEDEENLQAVINYLESLKK